MLEMHLVADDCHIVVLKEIIPVLPDKVTIRTGIESGHFIKNILLLTFCLMLEYAEIT